MPKHKLRAKNGFYFFMLDRRREMINQGFRFPNGMKDLASAVYNEWKVAGPDRKAYYARIAKEEKEKERTTKHNVLTATGESYANMIESRALLDEEQKLTERVVDKVTTFATDEQVDKRNFIVISTTYSLEEFRPRHIFWPLELGIGAFSLEDGLKSNYSTLVNTEVVSLGFRFRAPLRRIMRTTGLPKPGSSMFEPKHKDYLKILQNVKNFVEHFIGDYPDDKYVLFAMENDIESADGCLQWLYEKVVDSLNEEEKVAMTTFMSKLVFYKLPQLLIRFATITKKRNPNYNHLMVCFNGMEQAAIRVLNHQDYKYKLELACQYHNRFWRSSRKAHLCCKNIVLRRIYLILREIVPNLNLEIKDAHMMEKFVGHGVLKREPEDPFYLPLPVDVYIAQFQALLKECRRTGPGSMHASRGRNSSASLYQKSIEEICAGIDDDLDFD